MTTPYCIHPKTIMIASNVLDTRLLPCPLDPLTGFYRDGCCHTDAQDHATHLVCAQVTQTFLEFSQAQGNDPIRPSRNSALPA